MKNYSPSNPSPSIKISKLTVSIKGLFISISAAIGFLRAAFRSRTLLDGGDSVSRRTVHHIYLPLPSASVNVILPVYYPLSTGVILN